MRKTICTATIFAAMVGALVSLFTFHVPCEWWVMECNQYTQTGFGVWLLIHILLPISVFVLGCFAVVAAWKASSAICAKLRGEKAQQ